MLGKVFCVLAVFTFVACSADRPPEPQAAYRASQTGDGPLAREEASIVRYVATVTEVDVEQREITLKNSDGSFTTLDVSPEVKRLAEVEEGDRIVAEYYESLAYEVRPPTAAEAARPRVTVFTSGNASEALVPGSVTGRMTRTIVKVTELDSEEGTVTVRSPGGEVMTVRTKNPANLERIEVGDTVAVTYSRAVAVALEPYS